MTHTLRRAYTVLLLIAFGLLWQEPAHATITCSISAPAPAVQFGNAISPIIPIAVPSGPTDATGTISYQCNSNNIFGGDAALLCFYGSTSANGSSSPRQLTIGPTPPLNYDIYTDAGHSTRWSSVPGSPPSITASLRTSAWDGTTSGSFNLYGRVDGNQRLTAPGTYTDTLAVTLTINQASGFFSTPPTPTSCGGQTATTTPIAVQAVIGSQCNTPSVSTLDFGTIGLLTSPINSTTTIGVQCTNTTPYNVGIDAGQHAGGNVNARKMVLGTNSVAYQLYRDSARTQVWGTTIGTNTKAGTGSGNSEPFTVYGRVPAQTTPPAGTYNDTALITVTY